MIELLTTAEMAEADRLAIEAGTSGIRLMENAGRAVADTVVQMNPRGAPAICVVAGPGNNGGDGFVCARILAGRGYPVRLLLLGNRDRLKGDAAEAGRQWQGRWRRRHPGRPRQLMSMLFGGLTGRLRGRRGR